MIFINKKYDIYKYYFSVWVRPGTREPCRGDANGVERSDWRGQKGMVKDTNGRLCERYRYSLAKKKWRPFP